MAKKVCHSSCINTPVLDFPDPATGIHNPPPRITVEGGKTIVIQVDGSVDVSYHAATFGSYSIRLR